VFGKRSTSGQDQRPSAPVPAPVAAPEPARASTVSDNDLGLTPLPSSGLGAPITSPPLAPGHGPKPIVPTARDTRRSESYYEVKGAIFSALIEAIDLSQLARLDAESAREEIRDIVNEIIAIKSIVMSISEQEELLDDICNDVLGYGPLEPLLARDDIADIMVNGANTVYIEVNGKIQQTSRSASSTRSAAASTKPRRSAMRASPTARASTRSCRRSRSTGLRSPSASSRRKSSPSISW